MLPIALNKPITTYNMATTSPPINWLLDPVPAIRFWSNPEFILGAPKSTVLESTQRQTRSGQSRLRSSGRGPARHQHCKYDRNENERRHISHQMTPLGRIVEGLNAHDRPVNHARRLTLLPAIEGQGEGASPCFLLTVMQRRPISDWTIPRRCLSSLRSVA